jgi:hypothetical protein
MMRCNDLMLHSEAVHGYRRGTITVQYTDFPDEWSMDYVMMALRPRSLASRMGRHK